MASVDTEPIQFTSVVATNVHFREMLVCGGESTLGGKYW